MGFGSETLPSLAGPVLGSRSPGCCGILKEVVLINRQPLRNHLFLRGVTRSASSGSLQNYLNELKISRAVLPDKAKNDCSIDVNSFQINLQDKQG